MSGKTVSFGVKPAAKPVVEDADQWVKSREGGEKMKRLTFDVPERLHRAIKQACAGRGTKIKDEVVALLEEKYGTDKK